MTMPEEDRSEYLEQLERDMQEEWIPWLPEHADPTEGEE